MKPYTNSLDLTRKMLLEHPYFRNLTKEDLANVLNQDISFNIYEKLEGNSLENKAENLINNWKLVTETTDYQIY